MAEELSEEWRCFKCNIPLVEENTVFTYMGFIFNKEVPRCPKCGQVFISEELVNDRMLAVEMELEEK